MHRSELVCHKLVGYSCYQIRTVAYCSLCHAASLSLGRPNSLLVAVGLTAAVVHTYCLPADGGKRAPCGETSSTPVAIWLAR